MEKKMKKEYFTTEMFDAVNESASKNIARKRAEHKLDCAKDLLRDKYNNGEHEFRKANLVSNIKDLLWAILTIALAAEVVIAIFYTIIWVIMALR